MLLVYRRRDDLSKPWENYDGTADFDEMAPNKTDKVTGSVRMLFTWDIPFVTGHRSIGFVTGSMNPQNYQKRWLTVASRALRATDPNPLNFIDAYAAGDFR